jgi:hypothetical protein
MKPSLILCLAAAPLLVACAGESRRASSGGAEAPARADGAAQADADWSTALVAAKVTGSLYRGGAFFPEDAAGVRPAVALP